nr:Ger(x)C family spore germination protein [Defluviitalea raffinosedens]
MLCMILNLALLTGCWDNMSIDRRAFVLGLGIDKFIFDEAKDDPSLNNDKTKYRVAFSFPNIAKFAGEQGLSDEPKFVMISSGPTFSNTYKGLGGRLNKSPYFGHIKSIIFGKELLKDKVLFKEVLDTLQRNSDFSRSIPIVAIDGLATEAIQIIPEGNPLVSIYINQLFESNKNETMRFQEKDLGELLQNFQEDKMAMIPKLSIGEKDIKIAGAAIIKDYELKGWLDEQQTRGALWLRKKNQRLEISAPYEDFHVAYHVSNAKSEMKFMNKDNELSCHITIQAEGNLDEFILDRNILNVEEIKKVEEAIEKSIKEEVENSLKTLQEKYQADVVGIGKELERQKPKEWEKVKDHWEEVFETLPISIDVQINIRRIGQSK